MVSVVKMNAQESTRDRPHTPVRFANVSGTNHTTTRALHQKLGNSGARDEERGAMSVHISLITMCTDSKISGTDHKRFKESILSYYGHGKYSETTGVKDIKQSLNTVFKEYLMT